VDEWLVSLTASDHSPKTIESYRWSANRFMSKVTTAGPAVALVSALTPSNIEKFLVIEQEAKVSPATRQHLYRCLRAFGGWCVKRGLLPFNPVAAVSAPRVKVVPKPVLTDEDVSRLLASTESGKHADDIRDGALLSVLFGTGIRRGEASRIRVADWDHGRHTLWISAGKTKSGRTVYLPAKVEVRLTAYLRARKRLLERLGLSDPDWLFITRSGRLLTPESIYRVMRRRSQQSGVKFHPHLARHFFVHDSLLRLQVPLLDLATALGHSDVRLLETTYGVSGREERALSAFRLADGR
jgi:integrase/recombinase XerC